MVKTGSLAKQTLTLYFERYIMKISVIGHGFVGKAVEYGFTNSKNDLTIIDPNYGTSVEDLKCKSIDVHFVCVPTPVGEGGKIGSHIVQSVMDFLIAETEGLIVLKSTVTPNLVAEFAEQTDRFVYNPEFLTERNANQDFVNPIMHVFGGEEWAVDQLHKIYDSFSNCAYCMVYRMTAKEASFVKYGINSFLSTKVTWFNEYYTLIQSMGANYDTVIQAIGHDPRVSIGHTAVPGPDGKFGFGGACFKKDCSAILNMDEQNNLSILKQAVSKNNQIRSQYDLDEREIAQNIRFDD